MALTAARPTENGRPHESDDTGTGQDRRTVLPEI